jgi:hypothetical protein
MVQKAAKEMRPKAPLFLLQAESGVPQNNGLGDEISRSIGDGHHRARQIDTESSRHQIQRAGKHNASRPHCMAFSVSTRS